MFQCKAQAQSEFHKNEFANFGVPYSTPGIKWNADCEQGLHAIFMTILIAAHYIL